MWPAHFLVTLQQPRTRVLELRELRHRFKLATQQPACDGERHLAEEVRRLCRLLVEASPPAMACRTCAKGHPEPAGIHAGGHCCSGRTSQIFEATEIRILVLTGTKARHLPLARGVHAGCAFRGHQACSLPVLHRPTLCIRFLCGELRHELRQASRRDVLGLAKQLDAAMAAFAAFTEQRPAPLFLATGTRLGG